MARGNLILEASTVAEELVRAWIFMAYLTLHLIMYKFNSAFTELCKLREFLEDETVLHPESDGMVERSIGDHEGPMHPDAFGRTLRLLCDILFDDLIRLPAE
ncbi:hypothetical protein AVEN_262286-1 [Araneus ventricosus]|uniref:Uncharacterized protein n=1 Tax=Araneus ventricosus TaxID=182803 RepID=A0A4Y2R3Y3_ARAVE|nr:hypothetical protein AVEN_262286-1 [Araneus ventricosus]